MKHLHFCVHLLRWLHWYGMRLLWESLTLHRAVRANPNTLFLIMRSEQMQPIIVCHQPWHVLCLLVHGGNWCFRSLKPAIEGLAKVAVNGPVASDQDHRMIQSLTGRCGCQRPFKLIRHGPAGITYKPLLTVGNWAETWEYSVLQSPDQELCGR